MCFCLCLDTADNFLDGGLFRVVLLLFWGRRATCFYWFESLASGLHEVSSSWAICDTLVILTEFLTSSWMNLNYLGLLQLFGSETLHTVRTVTFWHQYCVIIGGKALVGRGSFRWTVNKYLIICLRFRFRMTVFIAIQAVASLLPFSFFAPAVIAVWRGYWGELISQISIQCC